MLVNTNLLDQELGKHLESMVGFRNIAVRNYTEINMDIVRSILKERLLDMKTFAKILIKLSLPPV